MFLQQDLVSEIFYTLGIIPDYVTIRLVPGILNGQAFEIIVGFLLALILLMILYKGTQLMYNFIKRFFFFLFIILVLWLFLRNFGHKIFTQNPDPVIAIIGIIGLLLGLAAFIISVFSLKHHAIQMTTKGTVPVEEEITVKEPSAPAIKKTQIQQPEMLAEQALIPKDFYGHLKTDRSLLAVISYIIIAQFGVFSGITVSAPNVGVGLVFFAVFFIAAFAFIKISYHDYKRGVMHLVTASFFGAALSIVLGHFWVEVPLETLLSIRYFETPSMVAFVTGIAVSLLLGSKD